MERVQGDLGAGERAVRAKKGPAPLASSCRPPPWLTLELSLVLAHSRTQSVSSVSLSAFLSSLKTVHDIKILTVPHLYAQHSPLP